VVTQRLAGAVPANRQPMRVRSRSGTAKCHPLSSTEARARVCTEICGSDMCICIRNPPRSRSRGKATLQNLGILPRSAPTVASQEWPRVGPFQLSRSGKRHLIRRQLFDFCDVNRHSDRPNWNYSGHWQRNEFSQTNEGRALLPSPDGTSATRRILVLERPKNYTESRTRRSRTKKER